MAIEALPQVEPWGIYLRISNARRNGKVETIGVDRQLPPTRALVERMGGRVYRVYTDNDKSAYSRKPRPAYEELLADAKAGIIRGIAVWDADRLSRAPTDNERIIDLAERHGVKLATCTGAYDLATPAGRLHYRMKGAVDHYESDHKAERVALERAEQAARGEPHGGGARPFGFNKDRVTHRAREAKLIQDAAARLIAGESVYRILAEWNDKGIRTSTGRRWSTTSFRRMLTSPRVAGLRQHGRDPSTREGQIAGKAQWDAILDETTWLRLRDLFGQKREDRKARQRQGPPAKHLLVGMLRCSKCGATLVTRMGGKPGTVRSYGCPPKNWGGGCGRTSIIAEPLEGYVGVLVIALLQRPRVIEALLTGPDQTDATYLAEIQRLTDDLKRLDDQPMTLAQHTEQRAPILAQLDQLNAERSRLRPRRGMLPLELAPAEAWWTGDVDRRRSLLGLVVDEIVIHPARPGFNNQFDYGRIEVIPAAELRSDIRTARIVREVLRQT